MPDEPVGEAQDVETWRRRSAVNLAAYWDQLARSPGQRRAQWDDAWAADPNCPHPVPNSATLLRPVTPDGAASLIARLDRFYAAGHGGPWMLWSAWPTPDLAPLGCYLVGHPPLMLRRPGEPPSLLPSELRIVEVEDAATLAVAESVAIDGYPLPELQPVRPGSLFDASWLGGPLRIWVGYVDGRVIATASAYVDDAVTGIYLVVTLPEARGRGYGAAITARAALANPAVPAVLQASDMGRPVYERLGFAALDRYSLWVKPRETATAIQTP